MSQTTSDLVKGSFHSINEQHHSYQNFNDFNLFNNQDWNVSQFNKANTASLDCVSSWAKIVSQDNLPSTSSQTTNQQQQQQQNK
ncbi:unnamed protein product, partial [Brachionus calyciflorus]